jgi:hypothetical protein
MNPPGTKGATLHWGPGPVLSHHWGPGGSWLFGSCWVRLKRACEQLLGPSEDSLPTRSHWPRSPWVHPMRSLSVMHAPRQTCCSQRPGHGDSRRLETSSCVRSPLRLLHICIHHCAVTATAAVAKTHGESRTLLGMCEKELQCFFNIIEERALRKEVPKIDIQR